MFKTFARFCRSPVMEAIRSRSGSIAPLFAVGAVPLVLAAGAAVDISRVLDERGQMQDIADSAALAGASSFVGLGDSTAAVTAASNYLKATGPRLAGTPTVTVTQTCGGAPTTAAVGTLIAYICATAPSTGSNYIGTVKVTLATSVKTTVASMVKPSVFTMASATAQGSAARNVQFTQVQNFSSSAADLNQIYIYTTPAGYTGTTLYQWTPSLSGASPILSNGSGFTNPGAGNSVTFQEPYADATGAVLGVGFALKNTTGGISGYGANCYGQAQGTSYLYYSHREDGAGSYWDYNVPRFNACIPTSKNWSALINMNGVNMLANCDTTDASYVSEIGGTCSSTAVQYPAGNYVYYTDSNTSWQPYDTEYGTYYSRNPLKFGTNNTDCTKGPVTYEWDDNGGSSDDNDFNDAIFTADCSSVAIQKASVRLLS